MPQLLFLQKKPPQIATSHESPFGSCGVEKNFLPVPRIEPQFLRQHIRSLVAMPMNYPTSQSFKGGGLFNDSVGNPGSVEWSDGR